MPIGEIAIFAGFGVAIVVSMGLLYGHRFLARRLEKDPERQPERSVELAAFWPLILLSAIFPILALANIENVYAYELGRWMMVGFFGAGTVWSWAVSRWQWYLRYAANQAYVVSMGSRDHGETPEMYQTAFRKAMPWAASSHGGFRDLSGAGMGTAVAHCVARSWADVCRRRIGERDVSTRLPAMWMAVVYQE